MLNVGGGQRVVAADAQAAALGLAPGFTLKAARALAPELAAAPHDPAADAELHRRLLALCRRFTPALAPDGADALVLDVAGCERLHGGEAELIAAVERAFACEGVTLRWGLADTPDLARAMARFAAPGEAGGVALDPGEGEAAAAALPVEALELPMEDVAALRGLGLRRVADAMARRGAGLSQALEGRLGARLDALVGAHAAPLARTLEPPRHLAERRLSEPVLDHFALARQVRRLAEALEPGLEARDLGARRLMLDLWGPDGTARRITVRTPQPLRRAREVADLLAVRLELLGEGAAGAEGVDQLRLQAGEVEPLRARTGELDGAAGAAGFEAFARFVAGRYGEGALQGVRPDATTAKPEREARWGAFAPRGPRRSRDPAPAPPPPAWGAAVLRPLRLFDPPEPLERVMFESPDRPPVRFTWRRVAHAVRRAEGPERLAPEWSREPEGARLRDYYRVEDEAGARFWLFREGLHPADADPRWFLHGLFA